MTVVTAINEIDGSASVTLPVSILKTLGIKPGDKLSVSLEDNQIVIEPRLKPALELEMLLNRFNEDTLERDLENRTWLYMEPIGRELVN